MRPCRDARDVSGDKRSKRNAIEALAAKRRQQQDQTSQSTSINLIKHEEDDNYSNQTHVNRTFKPHRRTTVITDSSSSSDEEQESTPSGPDDDDSNDSFFVDDDYISDGEEEKECHNVDTANNSTEDEEDEEEEEEPCHQPSSSTTTTTQQQPQFNLPPSVNNHIYAHQQQAIDWMLDIYNQEAGGILADDMGLGKTMSSAAFISGLFHSNMARRVLIIAPKTLLAHWKSELEVCGLEHLTAEFGGSVNERQRVLRRVGGSKTGQRGGGHIVLCTYGMLLHNAHLLSGSGISSIPTKIKWDVLFLDEGHKIKNHKIQLRQKLDELTTTTRIVITGTPIQNNLMELWSLFDYIQPGLLGDMAGFKSLYERRIVGGNDRHATLDEREKAAAASVALKRHIAPYMLRREKKDVMGSGADNNAQEEKRDGADDGSNHHEQQQQGSRGEQTTPSSRPQVQSISKKNDLICWLKPNPMQLKLYEAFLFSDEVRAALNSTHSPLAAITVLKKICDHPALLSERAQHTIIAGAERQKRRKQMKLRGGPFSRKTDSSSDEDDAQEEESDNRSSSSDDDDDDAFSFHKTKRMANIKPDNTPQHQNRQQQNTSTYTSQLFKQVHEAGIGGSCKTTFTLSLLRDLISTNHKVLIFSQSRVMLDILQAGIIREGWTWLRIDGTVASATERAQRVASFQAGAADIMMLTTQVGGLGLTLTAASRVIIVDPSWNPSTDQQSVDRAYRIGQDKHVVVYRLISCGTVEDKIYKKQVYKSGLAKGLLEDGDIHAHAGTTTTNNKMNSLPTAYFTNSELKDLFTLNIEETHSSSTRRALNAMHAGNREDDSSLSHHIRFLHTLDGFVGTSDHDLLFSNKPEEKLHVRSEDFIVTSASTCSAANKKKRTAKKSKNGNVYPSSQDVYNTTMNDTIAASHGSQRNNDHTNTNNAMWSGGGGDVSDMFAKALKLQESQQDQDVVVTATTGLTPQIPRVFSSSSSLLVPKKKTTTPEKTPEEQELSLQEQLEKMERLLSNKGLVDGLPDRGAKLEVKAALLRAQLSVQMQRQREEEKEEEEEEEEEGEKEVIVIMDNDDDEAKEKEEEDEEGGLPLQSTPPSSSHQEEVSEHTSFLRRLSGLASSFFTFSITDASGAPAVEVKDPSPPPPSSSFEDRDGVEKQQMVVAQLQKRLYACARVLNDPIKLSAYPDSPSALREKTLELEKEWREGKERLKMLEEMP